MAYRLRIYAPTSGVLNLYVTANGSSSIVYPAGESTPCYDLSNVTTAVTVSPSIASGYTFSRWVINIDGTTEYSYNEYLTISYNASWSNLFVRLEVTQQSTYYATVLFDSNGGFGAPGEISGSTTNADRYVVLSIPYTQPTRDGYAFLGWSLNQGDTYPAYYPGGTITLYGTVSGAQYTLYAIWQESGGGAHISTGGAFGNYTPYVFNGSMRKATPYIFNGSWRKAT